MNGSRRAVIVGLAVGGLWVAAGSARAAESSPGPDPLADGSGWSGVELLLAGGVWRISSLDPLGPAARAGLRVGDVIVDWSDGPLGALPAGLVGPPDFRYDLTVDRGGVRRPLCIILEQLPSAVRP